jgi:hypothetical protein
LHDDSLPCAGGLALLLQMLEDRSRALEEEVAELREAQDRDGLARDPRVAEKQLRVGGLLWRTCCSSQRGSSDRSSTV